MQEKFNLTGVYIAIYDQAFKIPDEEDNSFGAQYDLTKAGKYLTYIGNSDNHEFMFKKALPKGTSVTYKLMGETGDDLDPDAGNDGAEGGDQNQS